MMSYTTTHVAGVAVPRGEILQGLDKAHILHPHSVVMHPADPLILERGNGATVWDIDGNEYIDGTCGLWQCAVGHGRTEIATAVAEQLSKLEFYSSFRDMSNVPSIELAQRLTELAPQGFETVFYTNGGSEGVESAMKLLRLLHAHEGNTGRTFFLSRVGAYHGVTAGALTATGLERLKTWVGPLLPDFVHLSEPDGNTKTADELVSELDETIRTVGADRIAAFIGEPVLGVGGVVVPPTGYWSGVQQVLKASEIPLILDEVVTGFGRTGYWFGCERFDIQPDLIVTAKGISSGYIPMGAVLIHSSIKERLDGATFFHGFTYNGHPAASVACLKSIEILEREDLVDRARIMGTRLLSLLKELEDKPVVKHVNGVGLMLSVELENGLADAVMLRARKQGLLVRASQGRVVLSPPLVITDAQCERIASVLQASI